MYSPILGTMLTWLDLGAVNLTAGSAPLRSRSRLRSSLVARERPRCFFAGIGAFVLVASGSRGALLAPCLPSRQGWR